MRSADYLNDHPSIVFFFPDGMGIFQDDNAWIHQAQIVGQGHGLAINESRPSPDLNPTPNLWDELEKTLHSGQTLPSTIQDLGEKMQHWMEINLVTLHYLI